MPSILTEDDKEVVKRQVPKAANKIQAVAVARLYVAYPNRNRWTYTGLQGAVVLANDLVGNTYWLKLVDLSVCHPSYPHIWPCRIDTDLVARWTRSNMGSRNLRNMELQSGSDLLSYIRNGRLLGWVIIL